MTDTLNGYYDDISLEVGNLRFEFEHIGEGFGGDYNPEDPEDAPLLRFTVSIRRYDNTSVTEYWDPLEGCSYCTQVEAGTPIQVQAALLGILANQFLAQDSEAKRRQVCEAMSWMHEEWVDEVPAVLEQKLHGLMGY